MKVLCWRGIENHSKLVLTVIETACQLSSLPFCYWGRLQDSKAAPPVGPAHFCRPTGNRHLDWASYIIFANNPARVRGSPHS